MKTNLGVAYAKAKSVLSTYQKLLNVLNEVSMEM